MIATRKKFKREGNGFVETLENYQIGFEFTNGGINYRMICETFISDFAGQSFSFSFSLWAFEPINSVWSFVKNDYIVADSKTWIDANGLKYIDSGNNSDANNSYIWTEEERLDENGMVIGHEHIKTLKSGLVTEYDTFFEGILLGIIEPQISASIIDKGTNSITSIV